MEPQRVALYARVSTLATQNPEMQLLELQEYATRRAWQVVGEYVDHASGAKESRPALNRLMADARQRKFDVIAVWKVEPLRKVAQASDQRSRGTGCRRLGVRQFEG